MSARQRIKEESGTQAEMRKAVKAYIEEALTNRKLEDVG